MGILDYLSDFMPTFISDADAESPTRGGATTSSPASGTDEQSDEEKEINEQDAKSDDGEQATGHKPGDKGDDEDKEEPAAEEEEEEDDEPEDLKPKLEEGTEDKSRRVFIKLIALKECMQSKRCAPMKHHYDECADRVTQQIEEKGKAEEDCVEECKCILESSSRSKLN